MYFVSGRRPRLVARRRRRRVRAPRELSLGVGLYFRALRILCVTLLCCGGAMVPAMRRYAHSRYATPLSAAHRVDRSVLSDLEVGREVVRSSIVLSVERSDVEMSDDEKSDVVVRGPEE